MQLDTQQTLRTDVLATLEGGMDSGRAPKLVKPNQCAYAQNVTVRGGLAHNRPRYAQVPLTFSDSTTQTWFQAGRFQGAGFYDWGGTTQLLSSHDGQILGAFIGATGGGQYQSVIGDGNSTNATAQAWFCQADKYMIVQDGLNLPWIGNSTVWRRAAPTAEVPVGNAMAYGQGRLFVGKGSLFQAGDLVNGPSQVYQFTETQYWDEGQGGFAVPLTAGAITGMTFLEVGDTSSGQGDLLVFTKNSVFSVQAGVPRTSWATTPGMMRVVLQKVGGCGQWCLTDVNGDCFFRSKDGIRAYRNARLEQVTLFMYYTGNWGYTPQSREMNRILAFDDTTLLNFASSTLFKNRLLMTAQPTLITGYNNASAYFNGLVALDFDIVASISQKQPPAYDGFWTDLEILQVISHTMADVERCFVFVRNPTTKNTELWEIIDDETDYYDQDNAPIISVVETRAYNGEKPANRKKLRGGDLSMNNVLAETTVAVEYRADGYQAWVPWHSWKIPACHPICYPPNCPPANSPGCLVPGYWFGQRLPMPDATCDPCTLKELRRGYNFQFRITWTGPATLEQFVIFSDELIEFPNGTCP